MNNVSKNYPARHRAFRANPEIIIIVQAAASVEYSRGTCGGHAQEMTLAKTPETILNPRYVPPAVEDSIPHGVTAAFSGPTATGLYIGGETTSVCTATLRRCMPHTTSTSQKFSPAEDSPVVRIAHASREKPRGKDCRTNFPNSDFHHKNSRGFFNWTRRYLISVRKTYKIVKV